MFFQISLYNSYFYFQVTLTQMVDHPFSLTVFEDKLYWSDWSGKEIKVCDKFTGKDQKSLVRESKSRVYGMQIFHPSLFQAQVFHLIKIIIIPTSFSIAIYTFRNQTLVKNQRAVIYVY